MTQNWMPAAPLCFVGYMAGQRPGFTTSQGFLLSQMLRGLGWAVDGVSRWHNRWLRLIDISAFLVARGHRYEAIVMEVYGGRNFVLVDIISALASRTGQPVVMVLHGGSLPALFEQNPEWAGRVLRRARALVAPSLFVARAARERLGVPVEVIPNVVDTSAYAFRPRSEVKPRLLWMRAFDPVYNPAMAIRAFEIVRARYPAARLIMAGRDLGELETARSLAAARRLSDCIEFPGFLNAAAKARAFAEADIFLNTSRVDNMPVAVLEACAAGAAVVSTNVGGLPDLLADGRDALLVGDNDDYAMAQAVFRLLEEPGLATALGTAGREVASASRPESVIPRWRALFSKLSAES